jgi:hypothetical protein
MYLGFRDADASDTTYTHRLIGKPEKGSGTMTDNTDSVLGSGALQHGDHVTVHGNGQIRYSGYVDDTMPLLNIVWIRELRTGERKMFSTDECHIFRYQT